MAEVQFATGSVVREGELFRTSRCGTSCAWAASGAVSERRSVAIVGGGFGGVGAAAMLREAG